MGSIPKIMDLDKQGSTIRILDPNPYPYPLRLIKGVESMEKGERNQMIELHRYSIELRSEVGGEEDRRAATST
jgi:hypothetical protein